ncbi:cupin domain-containing protein [Spongiactinospora sp. 9N601]|uniref:cupin domain-containing protein n=1 Tax=Spongiactinospora sp. 9N601 TaxID=3375149 RepID=UPI0037963851
MPVIRHTERRRTETPNGVMTTLATPSQGGTAGLAVWHVEFAPGRRGPEHAFDTEQVWTFVAGTATVDLPTGTLTVEAGDTLVIPADQFRQMTADPERGFTAIVAAPAGTRVYTPADERIVPLWAR